MNFNEKLISLRKTKGLSQEELGAELNVTRQTISKWESCQSYPDFQRLVGRLRKGIGGAQRFPQNGRKPFEECKGRRELDCDTDGWSRYESRA